MHTSKVGDAEVSYFGQPKPQLSNSSGSVTVLGQAGATFSNLTLEPAPNLADTYLAFSREVINLNQLYILPYATGSAQILYQGPQGAYSPGISAYGTIAFNNASVFGSIFTVRPDGTGFRQLSFPGITTAYGPQYAVDGTNRIAFNDLAGNLYIAPGTGGTPALVQSNCAMGAALWSPSGTQLIYPVATGTGSDVDIYTTSTSGATTADITPTALRNTGTIYPVAWSPDGVTILGSYTATGSSEAKLIKFGVSTPGAYTEITPNGDSDASAYFSADGSKIAFYRSSSGGATPGIYLADSAGGNQTLYLPDPSGAASPVNGGICWSPFLPKETVVATSGSTFYKQTASGFLLSQNGSQFGSLVAFTAVTPSSATIQAPATSSSGAPMIFTLSADSITQIGYINSYFSPGTLLTSSAPTVIVSIDAVTGQVDVVAPASAKPSMIQNPDGTIAFQGGFKAIYDGTGNNLAPSGATTLVVNTHTGKLVSFR